MKEPTSQEVRARANRGRMGREKAAAAHEQIHYPPSDGEPDWVSDSDTPPIVTQDAEGRISKRAKLEGMNTGHRVTRAARRAYGLS